MKKTAPPPPKHLSTEARAWWRRITRAYGSSLDDDCQLVLQIGCEALDRLRGAQEAIARDGATVRDRFDQHKPHPLLAAERDARAQLFQALKLLGLGALPPEPPTRPYDDDDE